MPDDLAEQIAWVHQACEAMGVPILTSPGYEADDVIGTLAVRAVAAGYDVSIVSIDKDFFQLVADPHVKVYDPREDGTWFDESGVVQKFGVRPAQVVDVLALVGDTATTCPASPASARRARSTSCALRRSTRCSTGGVAAQGQAAGHPPRASGRRAPEPRARDDPHRRAARVDIARLAYRGADRERCYELFTKLAFRTLVNDYAPSMVPLRTSTSS
jgi:DNA polymerase-1